MWQVIRLNGMEPDEIVGEFDTEDEALDAGNAADEPFGSFIVIRRNGTTVWTNEAGPFERC